MVGVEICQGSGRVFFFQKPGRFLGVLYTSLGLPLEIKIVLVAIVL